MEFLVDVEVLMSQQPAQLHTHGYACHPSSNDDDFTRPRGFEVCISPLMIASKILHDMGRMMPTQGIRKRTATHWGDAVEWDS